jgi:hypothetical protein
MSPILESKTQWTRLDIYYTNYHLLSTSPRYAFVAASSRTE